MSVPKTEEESSILSGGTNYQYNLIMEDITQYEAVEDSQIIASAVQISELTEAITKLDNRKSGIYKFTNLTNNKSYIGQAINIRKRLLSHLYAYKAHKVNNSLYSAIQKYGIEQFEVKILQVIEDGDLKSLKSKLDYLEKYYIQKYNTYGATGYNQTLGGDAGVLGYKFTEEQLKRLSFNNKRAQNDGRNSIYCYDVITGITTLYTSISDLNFNLGIKIKAGNSRNNLCVGRYILGRTLQEITAKKDKVLYNGSIKSSSSGQYVSQFTEGMRVDILNGLKAKDFILKYSVCKKTYNNYKKQIFPNHTRVYTSRISEQQFIEVYSQHPSVKYCAEYFNESKAYIYDIRSRLKKKGLLDGSI